MTSHVAKGSVLLRRAILVAIVSATGLLGLFLGILTLANSLNHAIDQFILLWPWFSALLLGFGVQGGLFSYVRGLQRIRHVSGMASSKGMTAAGGVSTAAMAACCAHHVADFLPVVGLSGAALFLTDYQKIFLLLGVLSNIVGITVMFHAMQKHGLMEMGHPLLRRISHWNAGTILKWNVALSVVVFTIAIVVKIYE